MSDPFLAEIRIFPFNFAPYAWALCQGQVLPISQNTALFSLIGTYYGGNGISNFALPDLGGNVPMCPGQGGGLSPHDLGEQGGAQSVTLLQSEIPAHTHPLQADTQDTGDVNIVGPNAVLALSTNGNLYQDSSNSVVMSPLALAPGPSGGGLPHDNMQPYLTLSFCIALQGVFPQRG